MASNKHQVMAILNWTEYDYANYQFKIGSQYLQAYIGCDPARVDDLLTSRIFWNWFKNEWLFRDTAFLKTNVAAIGSDNALKIYGTLHDYEQLINTIYPNAIVMQNGYANMIGKLNDAA